MPNYHTKTNSIEELRDLLENLIAMSSQSANSSHNSLLIKFEQFKEEQEKKEEDRWKLLLKITGSIAAVLVPIFLYFGSTVETHIYDLERKSARFESLEQTLVKHKDWIEKYKELDKKDDLVTEKLKTYVTKSDLDKFKQELLNELTPKFRGPK